MSRGRSAVRARHVLRDPGTIRMPCSYTFEPLETWRCPHCGTTQADAARCWACSRHPTACGSCRDFRRAVAGRLGYCALDRTRAVLQGDEVRACWRAAVSHEPLEGLFRGLDGSARGTRPAGPSERPTTSPGPAPVQATSATSPVSVGRGRSWVIPVLRTPVERGPGVATAARRAPGRATTTDTSSGRSAEGPTTTDTSRMGRLVEAPHVPARSISARTIPDGSSADEELDRLLERGAGGHRHVDADETLAGDGPVGHPEA